MSKALRKQSIHAAPALEAPAADQSKTKAPRKPLAPVEAFAIYGAAPDDALLPPEVIAPVLGRDSIAALEKMRCIGEGPAFIKLNRMVRYRAGTVREYLRGLEQHTVTQ